MILMNDGAWSKDQMASFCIYFYVLRHEKHKDSEAAGNSDYACKLGSGEL